MYTLQEEEERKSRDYNGNFHEKEKGRSGVTNATLFMSFAYILYIPKWKKSVENGKKSERYK